MSSKPLLPAHAPAVSRILRANGFRPTVTSAGEKVSVVLPPRAIQGAQVLLHRYGYVSGQPTRGVGGADRFVVEGRMDCFPPP